VVAGPADGLSRAPLVANFLVNFPFFLILVSISMRVRSLSLARARAHERASEGVRPMRLLVLRSFLAGRKPNDDDAHIKQFCKYEALLRPPSGSRARARALAPRARSRPAHTHTRACGCVVCPRPPSGCERQTQAKLKSGESSRRRTPPPPPPLRVGARKRSPADAAPP
jgi:hypothetical protein